MSDNGIVGPRARSEARRLLDAQVDRYGAFGGVLMLRAERGRHLRTVVSAGTPPDGGEEPQWLPMTLSSPITATAKDGGPRCVRSAAQLRAEYGLAPVGPAASVTLPLALPDATIGAVGLWLEVSAAPRTGARLGGAAVDAVALALARDLDRSERTVAQLETALQSRVVIEQAKGILAARMGVAPSVAFASLRDHCRRRGLRLHETAQAIIDSVAGDCPECPGDPSDDL